MVNYLKKTKMYELAKELVPGIDGIRSCTYKFYRGTEWLKFGDDEYYYDFCIMGVHVSLDVFYYDELTDARVDVNRICYVLLDGQLKETYRRVS